MDYKLLAVDMDGTLLNDASVLTEGTKAAVLAAIERGVLFVPSTGRPLCGMRDMIGLFAEDLPFILFNGAMAVTGKTKQVLFSKGLKPELAGEIFTLGVSRGLSVVLWLGERLFVSRDCEETRKYQTITGAEMVVISDTRALGGQDATKMIWIIPPEDAPRLQSEMGARFQGQVNCHTSRPYLLEFVDAEASKGNALHRIGEIYGIDQSEMIAVGDGYNDVSMLVYAGLGVAMENAPDDIQALCQHVTESNNDEGVAAVIHRFILKEA